MKVCDILGFGISWVLEVKGVWDLGGVSGGWDPVSDFRDKTTMICIYVYTSKTFRN